MIPELGHFALLIALVFALLQCGLPLLARRQPATAALYTELSTLSSWGQFGFISFAFFCLILSFIQNDLTVIFVREHSHALLPWIYRIGAAWGGHEGSLVLWCFMLSGWCAAFTLFFRRQNNETLTTYRNVIMTLGFVSAGFIAFLLFTSDPFQRAYPTDLIVGDDLTPLLQDPGLIFHPPMLYLGYVGFAIAFAFAISALIEGKIDAEWARSARPWVVLPWGFLSCGIVLGSWWAYRELGWGGWWFWDPVENASLLPWLAATALIHTLAVCEKRSVFQGWTLLLAILTFSLSLLGTFLVRSGILVSVHAFASDPTRGIFLLVYLSCIIGGALLTYSLRIDKFYRTPHFKIVSRETSLLINSVFLVTAVATISLGTLYPIILDALNLEKISVGEPYFNIVFLPIILPMLMLMGLAPHLQWGQTLLLPLWKKIRWTLLSSILLSAALPALYGFTWHILSFSGMVFSTWIIISTLHYVREHYLQLSLRAYSMIIAHIGIAILALGVTCNKTYSVEKQVKMSLHETVELAGYQFTLLQFENRHYPNYQSETATFSIQDHHRNPELLTAEQRVYTSHDQGLSRPGIVANPFRDLYVALGNQLDDGSWSVRLYYKPCVRWIWLGGILLLIGGLLALFPPRRKKSI